MSDSQKQKDVQDEIDLIYVFSRLSKWWKNFLQGIINTLNILVNRWKLITLYIVFFLSIGIGLFFVIKPYYLSELTITSKLLSNDQCASIIDKLEILCKEKNATVIAERLNISLNQAQNLKYLEFKNFNDKLEELYEDSIAIGVPFKIEASVYDNSILNDLQIGIVQYLENNPFAVKRKNIKRESLDNLTNKVQDEITELDSLKQLVNKSIIPRATGTGIILGEPIDPLSIYKEAIDLYEEKLKMQEQIALIENIEIIEEFTNFAKHHRPKLWINLLIAGIIGFLFGAGVALKKHAKSLKA